MGEPVTKIEVHKFGGTSLADAESMGHAARRVREAAADARVVVVASAMAGVTDALTELAAAAAAGEHRHTRGLVEQLKRRHLQAYDALTVGEEEDLREALQRQLHEVWAVAQGVLHTRELTPRSLDRILSAGEKLSARLLAQALRNAGLSAAAMDADTFLETDDAFGEATPLGPVADRTMAARLTPRLERGEVVVVTGFCGRAPDGATTTLGRGGSDLSATVVAASLGAASVTLWTDVDGIFTADPRLVPDARIIPQLNYREAAEMSFYGANVLHQRTMIPVAAAGIPVTTRNTFAPERPGSVVDRRFTPGSHPVKATTAVRAHGLLSVEGKGMAGVPGMAARVFAALADHGISVTMISQSSSEVSICLAVPSDQARRAEAALKRAFRTELSRGAVEEVVVRDQVALVAIVGLGMARTPGVSARVFGALARQRINVLAIAQGSSELNISLAVAEGDVDRSLRAIHEEFGLHRRDTGQETAGALDVLLLGCGKIGAAVAELITDAGAGRFARLGIKARVVGVCDRSGYLFEPTGIAPAELARALERKAAGEALAQQEGGRAGSATDLIRHALTYRLSRPVLVDVSDAGAAHEAFGEAMALGCDVVTANKKPLADRAAVFAELLTLARETGRVIKAEATVGAGLPVMDTLEMLLAAGDRLTSAEGCLSGTLGFVMTRLEQGEPLSAAVAEAVRLGYTEPDPLVDLSGVDMARKAVILGRLSGLAPEAEAELAGLVDSALAADGPLELDELVRRLAETHDEPMAAAVASAAEEGKALRYVARIAAAGIRVGLEPVPLDSPLGQLRGTDNMIVLRSERYDPRPLVISGPGAGVEVTAMGVLGDILRVAAQRS